MPSRAIHASIIAQLGRAVDSSRRRSAASARRRGSCSLSVAIDVVEAQPLGDRARRRRRRTRSPSPAGIPPRWSAAIRARAPSSTPVATTWSAKAAVSVSSVVGARCCRRAAAAASSASAGRGRSAWRHRPAPAIAAHGSSASRQRARRRIANARNGVQVGVARDRLVHVVDGEQLGHSLVCTHGRACRASAIVRQRGGDEQAADFSRRPDGTLRFTGNLALARLGDLPDRLDAVQGAIERSTCRGSSGSTPSARGWSTASPPSTTPAIEGLSRGRPPPARAGRAVPTSRSRRARSRCRRSCACSTRSATRSSIAGQHAARACSASSARR